MLEWINIFNAECLKQKRSLILLLVFLAPGLMIVLNLLIGLGGYYAQQESGQQIVSTIEHNSLNLWCLIMLPIAMTLITALNANVEYRNHQWKHIYALPVPVWKVLTVKWLINVGLSALSHLIFFGLIILNSFYACASNGQAITGAIDYVYLIQHLGIIFLASILLITIHTLCALSIENFLIAMIFGTMMMVSNYFVAQSTIYGVLSPWAHPLRLHHLMTDDPYFGLILIVNILGSFLLAMVVFKILSKRQITN
jgi:hypothetical protein